MIRDWLEKHWPTHKGHIHDATTLVVTDKDGDTTVPQVIIGVMRVNEDGELEPLGTWDGPQVFNGLTTFNALATFASMVVNGTISFPNTAAFCILFGDGDTGIYEQVDDTIAIFTHNIARLLIRADITALYPFIGTDIHGTHIHSTGDLESTDDVLVGDDLVLGIGQRIALDDDLDTYILADQDDRVQCYVGGGIRFQVQAGSIQMQGSTILNMNTNAIINTNRIQFDEAAVPAAVAGHGQIYFVDNAGQTELWFLDDAGAERRVSPVSFGAFYGNNIAWTSVAFGGGGTFVIISDANITTGEVQYTTFQNNQELLIADAGKYIVTWSLSGEAAAANIHIEAGLGVDAAIQAPGRNHFETGHAGEEYAMAGTAILTLAAAEVLSVMITNVDNNTQVEVHHINLTAHMVGI